MDTPAVPDGYYFNVKLVESGLTGARRHMRIRLLKRRHLLRKILSVTGDKEVGRSSVLVGGRSAEALATFVRAAMQELANLHLNKGSIAQLCGDYPPKQLPSNKE